MKVIIDVDLGSDPKDDKSDVINALSITPGCLLIEDLPTQEEPLGPVETVSLSWEQRSRPRRKFVTSTGQELALALPRGTVLSAGMLILNTIERAIKVIAEPEDVMVLRPANQKEMCLIAHHLGNWHRSLQLNDDGTLLVEQDSPLCTWLNHQNIGYEPTRLPYHPNLQGAGHD
jgi:urease accessory protein